MDVNDTHQPWTKRESRRLPRNRRATIPYRRNLRFLEGSLRKLNTFNNGFKHSSLQHALPVCGHELKHYVAALFSVLHVICNMASHWFKCYQTPGILCCDKTVLATLAVEVIFLHSSLTYRHLGITSSWSVVQWIYFPHFSIHLVSLYHMEPSFSLQDFENINVHVKFMVIILAANIFLFRVIFRSLLKLIYRVARSGTSKRLTSNVFFPFVLQISPTPSSVKMFIRLMVY